MGLDPRMEQDGQIPKYLKKEFNNPNDIILEFNKALIDDTCDLIPIIKPQIAFYEKYEALDALKDTIKYAQKNDYRSYLNSLNYSKRPIKFSKKAILNSQPVKVIWHDTD